MPETPSVTFQEEKTERRYLVTGAPLLRSNYKKFPIVPDEIVVYLRDGLVTAVSARGHSILRSGGLGARHTFTVGVFGDMEVPKWIEDAISTDGLRWHSRTA